MKSISIYLSLIGLSLLIVSCSFNAETSQDSTTGVEANIALFIKGDYKAIYEDGSVEMKSYVSEEDFINISVLQEKMHGRMAKAELINETTGKYRTSVTNIYTYKMTSESGKAFTYKVELLRGHLLKGFLEEPDWSEESTFTKELVAPVAGLVKTKNAQEIYELLGEEFPLRDVENLINRVADDIEGVNSLYEYTWTDNDANGDMMVAFVYAYEGKGYLEYRFYIQDDNYPLAGIFFTPDTTTKLPV